MARTVRTPGGAEWQVRRRWAPRAPRWRWLSRRRSDGKRRGNWFDLPHVDADDLGVSLIIFVVFIAAVVLLFLGVPLLVFLVDFILIVLLAIGGVVARVLFRRPWLVEATDGSESRHWDVVGWRASTSAIAQIEAALRNGRALPTTFVRDKATGPLT